MMEKMFHLLFPDVCVICGSLLNGSERYCCTACISGFDRFRSPSEAEEVLRHAIATRFSDKFLFDRGWSLFWFHKDNSLQQALHAMKYEGLFTIGTLFGHQLGQWMLQGDVPGDIDCVVPVPLHYLKKVERSFNQAEKIAEGIAQSIHKPVRPELLKRKRYTESQTSLPAPLRRKNPAGAFQAGKSSMPPHVLLVDDVITTGATIASAASALRAAGVRRVSIASVALAAKE
ncbi:MAG: ComF family protein [Chlorobium sp.]|nr:MAG: ComF family protein [Chlorobium sp.]